MTGSLSRKYLMIVAGLVLGAVATLMSVAGNPANMGICLACFYRDITGALGLHRAATVQYLRPEIMGMALGGFISALVFGEFRARGGSAPLVRFFLGVFFMVGAMVFLGCPVRAVLRLAGGDLNGLTGIAGVVAGALIGIYLLKNGFNLGRSTPTYAAAGWIMPLFMLSLLLLAIFKPQFILASKEGPGAATAPLILSLVAGLLFGFLAQRTRMCFVGGWRDLFLVKDTYLFSGIAAFFVGALIINVLFGKIQVGFVNQPISHNSHLWNFLGMTLAGLTATLLGGCPLRQTILAAEGDTDAGITLWGIIAGAAFAHNFGLASSPQGPSPLGPVAVLIGLAFALAVGLLMREKVE
ncbi:YedE family putative selenium transporter [Moorellaceae bacterium AZ2]